VSKKFLNGWNRGNLFGHTRAKGGGVRKGKEPTLGENFLNKKACRTRGEARGKKNIGGRKRKYQSKRQEKRGGPQHLPGWVGDRPQKRIQGKDKTGSEREGEQVEGPALVASTHPRWFPLGPSGGTFGKRGTIQKTAAR